MIKMIEVSLYNIRLLYNITSALIGNYLYLIRRLMRLLPGIARLLDTSIYA